MLLRFEILLYGSERCVYQLVLLSRSGHLGGPLHSGSYMVFCTDPRPILDGMSAGTKLHLRRLG